MPHKKQSHPQSRLLAFWRRTASIFHKFEVMAGSVAFGRIFLGFGALTLLLSSLWWSWMGANLQNGNADQAVIAYLFHSPGSLPHDYLPSAHSFLLKWPFFWLVSAFHNPKAGLVAATMCVVMITILGLMFVLWRLERRPLMLGTWYAVLASVLLLVPPMPAPGNLLPVNMAMLATRNIEYLVLILAIWLIVRYNGLRNWRLWVGIVLLGILVASDKLFVPLVLGGAAGALVLYAGTRGWHLVATSVRWLLGGVAAVCIGIGLLALLGTTSVHIQNDGVLTPYGFNASPHQLLVAASYGIVAIATNTGILPAPTDTLLADEPSQLLRHILSGFGVAILVNIIFLLTALIAAVQLLAQSIRRRKQSDVVPGPSYRFILACIWMALAASLAFVLTNHYYAGDARYLSIVTMALLFAAALFISKKALPPAATAGFGIVAILGVILAIGPIHAGYHLDRQSFAGIEKRNQLVVSAVKNHGSTVLVGDYWRVVPMKLAASSGLNIMPLQNCSEQRAVLTRSDWQHDLTNTRFAYLLSFDKSLTDYPQCSLQQVLNSYGEPNAATVTAGTILKPTEMVLFYDHGAHHSDPPATPPVKQSTIVTPTPIDEFPYKVCNVPTVMNIVAHEDDDLLFMNPDITADIRAGHCVRTVYMTAGDSGQGAFYWLGRMRGSEAAYDRMLGYDGVWEERMVKINLHEYVTIANPRGNMKVALVFVYLPDGNLKGQGFADTKYQSLEKLQDGKINDIETVYGGSFYSSAEITRMLTGLMDLFQPSEIRTQSDYIGTKYIDHSDHRTVGQFAAQAAAAYDKARYEDKVQIPITYYLGYPTHELSSNLSTESITQKRAIFKAYSQFDPGVCHGNCMADPAYGAYLARQHTWPN